jgi:hypothetical protein
MSDLVRTPSDGFQALKEVFKKCDLCKEIIMPPALILHGNFDEERDNKLDGKDPIFSEFFFSFLFGRSYLKVYFETYEKGYYIVVVVVINEYEEVTQMEEIFKRGGNLRDFDARDCKEFVEETKKALEIIIDFSHEYLLC